MAQESPPPPTAPTPAASSVEVAAVAPPTQVARPASVMRSARDEQVEAGEAALRRGDASAAAQLLAPWAAAGVPRAQALLGRAREALSGGQPSQEAYVWYSLAARAGQSEASLLRDKAGAKLQPAELLQAEQTIERWKPRTPPGAATTAERAAP